MSSLLDSFRCKKKNAASAKEALEKVGLADQFRKKPAEDHGQMQGCFARALSTTLTSLPMSHRFLTLKPDAGS